MGLLAGVLVSGSARMLATRPVRLEQVFWEAADASRRDALQHDRDVRLRYDAKDRVLVGEFSDGLRRFALPPGEGRVDFIPPANNSPTALLIGGNLVETTTLPAVTFYRDGTCSPFRVQVVANGPGHLIEVDPWTAAPVLKKADK